MDDGARCAMGFTNVSMKWENSDEARWSKPQSTMRVDVQDAFSTVGYVSCRVQRGHTGSQDRGSEGAVTG